MIWRPNTRPLIWVEGVVGAGKSMFSKEIGKRLGYAVLKEPVEGNPYLDRFYKDQKRWAWPMQIELLAQRYALQLHAATIAVGAGEWNGAILDRSISGDRVFCKMHMQSGNISELEWTTYEKFYNIMTMSLLPPTLIVYLDCTPETALERIQKRDRAAERDGLDLDYLYRLQEGYSELWREAEHGLMPWGHAVKVTTMLWDPVNDMPDWDRHAAKIKDIAERRLG